MKGKPVDRSQGPKGGGERVIPAVRSPNRAPRAGRLVAALDADLQKQAAAIIDAATGAPHGARILQALSVIATGTPQQIQAFFGHRVSMKMRDRQAALAILEARRFGRVPLLEEAPADSRPVQIVNVFSSSAEYDFVTQGRPKTVTPGGAVVGELLPPEEP